MRILFPFLSGIALITSLFSLSANAEQYQGVHQFHSTSSRADVLADAELTAHSANPYREGASSGLPPPLPKLAARSEVHAQAWAATRAGNLYADGADAGVQRNFASTRDRQVVHAEARVTASHGVTEGTQ
ncbi:MAG: helicase SNF2 [Hyphomicrobiales bacterium]|nr:MAG: helicase SNF2 [Hyphomicrobiales bacterium]